jgi:hypothetical protein
MPNKSDSRGGRGWGSRGRRSQGADRAEGAGGGMGGYRKLFRGNRKGAGNNSRNGCFPKLFMLLLPLIAVGTYLFFVS